MSSIFAKSLIDQEQVPDLKAGAGVNVDVDQALGRLVPGLRLLSGGTDHLRITCHSQPTQRNLHRWKAWTFLNTAATAIPVLGIQPFFCESGSHVSARHTGTSRSYCRRFTRSILFRRCVTGVGAGAVFSYCQKLYTVCKSLNTKIITINEKRKNAFSQCCGAETICFGYGTSFHEVSAFGASPDYNCEKLFLTDKIKYILVNLST
jgi:hypothetical protein